MSETSTCRPLLAPYCQGNGLDIGAGGDPITPTAICIDRPETHDHRAHVGSHPTHLAGDAADLYWFADATLDYAFSSHALEDFSDTTAVLHEWLRVLRPGGLLILFLPDQPTYTACCAAAGSLPNQAHRHANFSLDFVRARLAELSGTIEVEARWPFPGNPYSFSLVVKKV